MPAEIVILEWCAQYHATFKIAGSKPGTSWHVTTDGMAMYCDCPSFKHKPLDDKECKHTRLVFDQACLYNPQWYEGGANTLKPSWVTENVIPDSKCPGCGGPTIPVRCAV